MLSIFGVCSRPVAAVPEAPDRVRHTGGMRAQASASVIGVLLTAICTCVAGCSSTHGNKGANSKTGASTKTVSVPPLDRGELGQVLDEWMRRNTTPGAVVGVKVGDRAPVFVAAGEADRHTHARMSDTAAFRIGSVTKVFVGAVALQLSEQRRLNLDATIDRWLPRFPNARRITVRQLLTHRSGLAPFWDDSGAPGPYSAVSTAFVAAHLRRAFTTQEIVAFVKGRPLLSKPGTAVHYSNVNTILLGIIVSDVTHADLATALHKRLLDPLGLPDTYYAATEHRAPAPTPGVMHIGGRVLDESAIPDTGTVTALGAAGAMVSTPRDLIAFSTAYFRARVRGQRNLSTSVFKIGPGGTGLGVEGFSGDGFCALAAKGCPPGVSFFAVGATGSVPGGSAVVVYDSEYDLSVVALANSDQVDLADLAEHAGLLTKLGTSAYEKSVGFTAHTVPTTVAG